MGLSPEERRKIYEEEKARIDTERRVNDAPEESTTGLKPSVAGLLCYLAGWITGIIFLVIEQKSRQVRFHAAQSIVVFGTLTVASALLTWIPYVGGFFGTVIGILTFILWIVLMYRAYHGETYMIPLAGDLAMSIAQAPNQATEGTREGVRPEQAASPTPETATVERPALSPADRSERKIGDGFTGTRAGRIAASSFVIAWSIALLIFFSFFHKYIAYYQGTTVGGVTTWTRTPVITDDYYMWLPILLVALILSVAGHIILLIHDKYWLRQLIHVFLNVMGIVVLANLVSIFPFDFDVIPDSVLATALPVVVRVVLVGVAVALGIATLVILAKLTANLVKRAAA